MPNDDCNFIRKLLDYAAIITGDTGKNIRLSLKQILNQLVYCKHRKIIFREASQFFQFQQPDYLADCLGMVISADGNVTCA